MLARMPAEERPRERLLRDGAHTLEPEALLALVLGTGRGAGEDALALATRVLNELGGVEALAAAQLGDLRQISGIGPVKAARIRAAFELALRAGPIEPPDEPPAPLDPLEAEVSRLRGQIAQGEAAVLGVRPGANAEPVTLELGTVFSPQARIGSHLARLLVAGPGPWWIVLVRPGGGPRAREQSATTRLLEGAATLGLAIERVLLITAQGHHTLAEAAKCGC
ncbi:MAG: hypothetical protein KC620_00585 [Myxococcales bacterium]|nr:hypothetical protein [Myxococcales bacterium]